MFPSQLCYEKSGKPWSAVKEKRFVVYRHNKQNDRIILKFGKMQIRINELRSYLDLLNLFQVEEITK